MAADATSTAIQAIAAANKENSTRQSVGPKVGGPVKKLATFKMVTEDKYDELKNFGLKINDVFKSYNMPDIENIAIIKNWIGRKGLQLLETLAQSEKEKCETTKGLFSTLNSKFKPWYNETFKSLQFHKLVRQSHKNAGEWMGRFRIATADCNYKEIDTQLKEQFIHGLNDNDMIMEIIEELTKTEIYENVTSEQILVWARRVEAQKAQSAI